MWAVSYTADALKTLTRMDRSVARRIRDKILALSADPLAPNNNVKKLQGVEGFRLRVGDWRVIYTLEHSVLTVVVVKVGHRGSIYE